MSEIAVLLAAVALLIVCLTVPMTTPDEVRYSEIPAEMLRSGEWVVPQLHGEPYLDKPPLHYWLVAGSYRLFGPRPKLARWPSVAAGALSLLALFGLGSLLFGRRIALSATTLLAVTPAFQFAAHYANLDALFMLWTTLSQLALWLALRDRDTTRMRWLLLAGLSCGLAILTKGPVALVIAVPPVLAWDWLRRHRLRVKAWATFTTVAGLVAAPWFVAVVRRHPEFLEHFFVQHHLHRFTGALEHQRPWWFYIPVLLIALFPVSFLLPGTLAGIVKLDPEVRRQRAEQLGVVVLAAIWPIVFFSLSSGKLPSYVLPALPFLAILLGWHGSLEPPPRAWLRNGAILALSFAASLLLAAGYEFLASSPQARSGLALLPFWILLWATAAVWCQGWKLDRAATTTVAALLLNIQLLTTVLPRTAEARSLLGRATWHARNLDSSAPVPIVIMGPHLPRPEGHSHPVLQLDPDNAERLTRLLELRERLVLVAEPPVVARLDHEGAYVVRPLERGGHVYSLLRRGEIDPAPLLEDS